MNAVLDCGLGSYRGTHSIIVTELTQSTYYVPGTGLSASHGLSPSILLTAL